MSAKEKRIFRVQQAGLLFVFLLVAALAAAPVALSASASADTVSNQQTTTAAETLIAGCNYIIYKPLPGQETGNAVYLEQYCGAQVAGSPQEVKTMVCRYADVDSQVRLLQKQQRSLKYGKPGAAEEISNYILKKLEK